MTIHGFDRNTLIRLIAQFRSAIKRARDTRLARDLEEDLLSTEIPRLRHSTILRLAKWCKTGGIYADGMIVLPMAIRIIGVVAMKRTVISAIWIIR
jgi:hypothetical protein